jgi:hypothetical protein
MKKTQISIEFVLIFALVFIALTGFLYIINQRISQISESHELLIMKDLANNIKNEVILASTVNNNYIRRFDIPSFINGKKYSMMIKNNELTINLFEEDMKTRTYFTVFPVSVKGGFIDDITINTTQHCITKNNYEGIRIARNQVSLVPGTETVKKNSNFNITVNLNCVQNMKSAQFTIRFNASQVQIIPSGITPLTILNKKGQNALFNDFLLELSYTDPEYMDIPGGIFTYGFIATECETGSGEIVRIPFRVTDAMNPGEQITIDFDTAIGDKNLQMFDCNTNKFTKEDLPDSKDSAKIIVN